jgi:manganese/zinc/iron transport system permease protein
MGMPIRTIELILTTLTVLAVVIGIQAVGVVLMAAMLITPAAAARFWTERVQVMVILAAVFGAVSGFAGAFISYTAPSMPTGPWIVVVVSLIAFFSFFFAPGKGIIHRMLTTRRIRRTMTDENILKAIYNLGERDQHFKRPRSFDELLALRSFEGEELTDGLKRLKKDGFLEQKNGTYMFTQDGLKKGKRVVKLHRLWELYLTQYLRIAPDHVHDDAETIEHILTPELEAQLEKLLDYPDLDPHQSKIPY